MSRKKNWHTSEMNEARRCFPGFWNEYIKSTSSFVYRLSDGEWNGYSELCVTRIVCGINVREDKESPINVDMLSDSLLSIARDSSLYEFPGITVSPIWNEDLDKAIPQYKVIQRIQASLTKWLLDERNYVGKTLWIARSSYELKQNSVQQGRKFLLID